jgi:hypothetical protein
MSESRGSGPDRRHEGQSASGEGTATATARLISVEKYVVTTRGLRFAPPLIELATNPEGFNYWWSQLQFVFDVNDPREFGQSRAPQRLQSQQALRRYVETARALAKSTLMNSADGVTVNFTRVEGDAWQNQVEAWFSAPDAIAGFTALFRQLYTSTEAASFQKAMTIMRLASGSDAVQSEELLRWGRAVKQLRLRPMRQLILEKLVVTGEWPELDESDRQSFATENPERIISEYFYGEHLHWGKHAQTLETRKQSEFVDAWMRMAFLDATRILTHLYLGFAVLVEAAVRPAPL